MAKQSAIDLVLGEYRTALSELTDFYAGNASILAQASEPEVTSEVTATIGLWGEQITTSISIATSLATVRWLASRQSSHLGDRFDAADWLGELANQLVGRLKNKLACYGEHCQISMPTTIVGSGMQVVSKGPKKFAFAVRNGEHQLVTHLTLHIAGGLVLQKLPEEMAICEGTVELF